MEADEQVKNYNFDIEKLKKEQTELAKKISLKDRMNFSKVKRIGAIDSIGQNIIVSAAVVVDLKINVLDNKYHMGKTPFPYIPGFRAFRELPFMLKAFSKLETKPQVVIIRGHGIAHERLGLASHFGLKADVPTIGVASRLLAGVVFGQDIILNGRRVGMVINRKGHSKTPLCKPWPSN